nr:MAG: hypothetical protein [Microviridae sp.]
MFKRKRSHVGSYHDRKGRKGRKGHARHHGRRGKTHTIKKYGVSRGGIRL